MKKILAFVYILCLVQLTFGAASSSSGSSSSSASCSSLPYLDLLLNLDERLGSIIGDDYEKKDLKHYARERFYPPGPNRFLHSMLTRIEQGESVSSVAEQIPEDTRGKKFDIYINLLKELMKASDTEEAIRMLTAGALTRRLKPAGRPEIIQAFFSPLSLMPEIDTTKIEETIRWLIRSEHKSIKIAAYYFTNVSIMLELIKALKRHVAVTIVISKESPKQEMLGKYHLPYRVWKVPKASSAIMHHKFILFESNIDGDSILVNGSYNLTNQANNNHENVIVLNDKAVFHQFVERFTLLEQFSELKSPLTYIKKKTYSAESASFGDGSDAAARLLAALEKGKEKKAAISILTEEQLDEQLTDTVKRQRKE